MSTKEFNLIEKCNQCILEIVTKKGCELTSVLYEECIGEVYGKKYISNKELKDSGRTLLYKSLNKLKKSGKIRLINAKDLLNEKEKDKYSICLKSLEEKELDIKKINKNISFVIYSLNINEPNKHINEALEKFKEYINNKNYVSAKNLLYIFNLKNMGNQIKDYVYIIKKLILDIGTINYEAAMKKISLEKKLEQTKNELMDIKDILDHINNYANDKKEAIQLKDRLLKKEEKAIQKIMDLKDQIKENGNNFEADINDLKDLILSMCNKLIDYFDDENCLLTSELKFEILLDLTDSIYNLLYMFSANHFPFDIGGYSSYKELYDKLIIRLISIFNLETEPPNNEELINKILNFAFLTEVETGYLMLTNESGDDSTLALMEKNNKEIYEKLLRISKLAPKKIENLYQKTLDNPNNTSPALKKFISESLGKD